MICRSNRREVGGAIVTKYTSNQRGHFEEGRSLSSPKVGRNPWKIKVYHLTHEEKESRGVET